MLNLRGKIVNLTYVNFVSFRTIFRAHFSAKKSYMIVLFFYTKLSRKNT